jgi:hypothetical protein
MNAKELPELLGGHQRLVAREHQDLVRPTDGPFRDHDGVAGAERLPLVDVPHRERQVPRPDGLLDLVPLVAHHQGHGLGPDRPDGLEDVPQDRPAADRMEDLGRAGLQPLALSSGHDYGGEAMRRSLGQRRLPVGDGPFLQAGPASSQGWTNRTAPGGVSREV